MSSDNNTQCNNAKKLYLTERQYSCLERMGSGRLWRYGFVNGWLYNTAAGTRDILAAIHRKGLLDSPESGHFIINDKGRKYLADVQKNKDAQSTNEF